MLSFNGRLSTKAFFTDWSNCHRAETMALRSLTVATECDSYTRMCSEFQKVSYDDTVVV